MDPEDDLLDDDQLDLDDQLDEDDPDDQDLDDQDQGDPDDQDADPEPPRQSRGETRAAKLAREAKELRESNQKLARDMEDLQRRVAAGNAPPQETAEQFNARLSAMDPAERALYLTQLNATHMNNQMQAIAFRMEDQADKSDFKSFCQSNQAARKLEGEVEKRLAEYRGKNINIPRMDVLKHLLGERAIANLDRSTNRARKGADERRQRQTGRPGASARSDTRGEERTTGDKAARDKRLENLKI